MKETGTRATETESDGSIRVGDGHFGYGGPCVDELYTTFVGSYVITHKTQKRLAVLRKGAGRRLGDRWQLCI